MSWKLQIIQRLLETAHPGGGWPYQVPSAPSAEPTALACLALAAQGVEQASVRNGLRWLADRQQVDGSVAVNAMDTQSCWATALACLAWYDSRDLGGTSFSANKNAAVDWLLKSEGKPFKSNPAIYGHDTQLTGWSWVAGTHSWVEPTAYAILALRATGLGNHPRTREGVSLLLNRAISEGGWNYGNSKMFGSELRPFPAQTGMVLAALAGEPRQTCVDKAIQFLHSELPRVRTPVSLGWGLIGATAWQARPDSADSWLADCAERMSYRPAQPLFDAMLLLADAQPCPLLHSQKEFAREA
jgi:hypothetical protein